MTEPISAARAALLSDGELVAHVLAGDRDLFHVLVNRYQQPLFRIAFGMVLDEDTAADIVQDTFVRAYTNLASCRDPDRFRVWLFTTLRHRGLDWLREKRRRDLSLDEDGVLDRLGAAAVDGDADERLALRSELERALARLSPSLREAFILKHVEQLAITEVAEVLNIGPSAVKMRLLRARSQLQDWLAPAFELPGGPAPADVTPADARPSDA